MRKIWWLPVICIAAGAVQALSAADEPSPPARKGIFGSRSRLLIYSKQKTQVRNPDAAEEEASSTARAKISTDEEINAHTAATQRYSSAQAGAATASAGSANAGSASGRASTGTTNLDPLGTSAKSRALITPSSEYSASGTQLSASPVAKAPVAATSARTAPQTAAVASTKTAVRDDFALPPARPSVETTEIDEAEARRLFESGEPSAEPATSAVTQSRTQQAAPAIARPAVQSAARPEATAGNVSAVDFAAKPTTPAPVNASTIQARKTERYKELLESVQSIEDRPAPSLTKSDLPKGKSAVDSVQQVSGQETSINEFDINPFEANERPSKVINAGLKQDAGRDSPQRIMPTSATSTGAKISTGNVSAAKSPVTKMPEVKKPTITKTPVTKVSTTAKTISPKTAMMLLPAENNQAPQIDVKWEARGEVTLGEQCQCVLIVKNNGKVPAKEIVVEASFPESVRLVQSTPFPKSSSSKLEWQFPNLGAGEQKTIELTLVPTKRGELAASAQVRFTGTAATSFQVSEPMLQATVKMAKEINLGEPAAATVTVSNPGTGTAQNVVIQAVLPDGLSSASGRDFSTDIGPLGPGETRTVKLNLIATSGGEQVINVVAKSSTANLEQSVQAEINVLAPSLKLAATGPDLRYLHRVAKYVLTATNSSNTAAENVRISQVVAPGFDFVSANHGGRWDAQNRTVSWYVGHLEAGRATTVELDLTPQKAGEFRQAFRVTGDAGVEGSAVVMTRVEGAAALVMEVKDTDEPVKIGSDMTYEIRVQNEGSKSAQKVAITCELPPDVELVKVDGPTAHIVESGVLIFKAMPELAASDSLSYRITVKSTVAGTARLRARLTSESIQKPVVVEEATQFFAE